MQKKLKTTVFLATERLVSANRASALALKQKRIAELNAQKANKATKESELQKQLAIAQKYEAELARYLANQQKDTAFFQRVRAEKQESRAMELRLISIAKSLAIKSINVEKSDLKSLLAFPGIRFQH